MAKDLTDHLKTNGPLIIAEGYLFEFIRRGRLRAGSLVPEVVLDHPDAVKAVHQEFVDAGSDVVQAFTYYAHRQKMKDIGREDELEKINKTALSIAKEVARKNNKFFAGGLCNSNLWDPNNQETIDACVAMFTEQCRWAKEAGVDYMIAETFWDYGEASLALKILKKFGFTAVITICPFGADGITFDGIEISEALTRLEAEGADVVGLNCGRGPKTMIPLIKKCKEKVKIPLACLPVCYRTDDLKPNFQRLTHIDTGESCYPHDLVQHSISLKEVTWFADQCKEIGVDYIGLCCGNDPNYMRTLTKVFGRNSALDKYGQDRGKNVFAGDSEGRSNRYTKIQEFSGVPR